MEPAKVRSSSDSMETVPPTSSPAYAASNPVTRAFDTFASSVTRIAGSPIAFGLAIIIVIVWGITGPLFHYSDA
ncbi:hypothetical protein LMG22037_01134 [Paraburkholderia phenoliruptrix]|nr:hypothetical protein LMG22037_01134 [Paraburkholderia phenoliruptrix]